MAPVFQDHFQDVLHLRFEGRSEELPLARLDLTREATDAQIKTAVAAYLGRPQVDLEYLVVIRHHRTIVLRPEAIYG